MEWQPIETAPKDGTRIMAWWPDVVLDKSIGVTSWMAPVGYCIHWTRDGRWSPFDPTHWMPLPAPPVHP